MNLYILYTILSLAVPLVAAKEKTNLQWAICDRDPQSVLQKLGMGNPGPYKENPITYYDEQPPVYISHGLMFRTKVNKGQPLSTVKARFHQETSDVPDGVECSWDRYGDKNTYTCEQRCPLRPDSSTVWCQDQVNFAERYQAINWAALHAFGPYPNAKWKLRIEGHKAKFDDVAAGDLHLMEIEAKVPTAKADKAYQRITQYLHARGVVLCEQQVGKTLRLFRAMGYPVGDEHDKGEL
ncbi:hypothetical protein BBP40_004339 [Aspergillus hancockii]|nr:hypothetical protein BBP40_004339 [Aspergillus hancockii]